MTSVEPTVHPDSHLTLHYRVSLAQTVRMSLVPSAEIRRPFSSGSASWPSRWSDACSACGEGRTAKFELEPENAFGVRNPELVQKVARSMLDKHGEADGDYRPGDLVDFPAPDGRRFAGVLKEINDQWALFDFNHPLAGQRIRLQVEILGIL